MSASTCTIDGCSKDRASRSRMCSTHRNRLHRHGSPDVVKFPTPHPAYSTVHNRLMTQRGPAKAHVCVDCGAPAKHWSLCLYSVDEYFVQERAGSLLVYSADLDAYDPRCTSCHAALDARIRQEVAA